MLAAGHPVVDDVLLMQAHGHGMFTPVPPFPSSNNATGTAIASSSSSCRSLLVDPSAEAAEAPLVNWLPRRLSQQVAALPQQDQQQQQQQQQGRRHSHRPVLTAPFHHTMAELYGAVAQYYDTPWLSFRYVSAVYIKSNQQCVLCM
jgi:hypothetical protein